MMYSRLLAACVSAAALVGVALAQPADDAPAAKFDDKSEQVLRRLSDHFAGAENFAVGVQLASEAKIGEREQSSTTELAYVVRKPGEFEAVYSADGQTGSIIGDGETITVYMPSFKQYMQSPQAPDHPLGHDVLGMLLNGALVTEKPLAFLKTQIAEASYVGQEKLDGAAADHLRLASAQDGVIDVWISDDPQPRPLKVVVDQSALAQQQTGQPAKVIATITYDDWRFDQELADDRFAFTAPAGVKLVQEFSQPDAQELVGQRAPDFTLTDAADNEVSLSDFKGKQAVVLDFWATWCGPCVVGMPVVKDVTEDTEGVTLLAINQRETPDTVAAFFQRQGFTVPTLFDRDAAVSAKYRAHGIPQTVLIDKQGIVREVKTGVPRAASVEASREVYRQQLEPLVKKLVEAEAE